MLQRVLIVVSAGLIFTSCASKRSWYEKGLKEGRLEGLRLGEETGYAKGHSDGKKDGFIEGFTAATRYLNP